MYLVLCTHAVARFGIRVILNFAAAQDLVLEGTKHLFSLCEKRHFAPVRNRLQLIRTVQPQYIRQ
jgi:hypothetical protein